MARSKRVQSEEKSQDLSELGQVISEGIAAGIAKTQPPRKITIGQYNPNTAFQPDKKKIVKLTRSTIVNGHVIDSDGHFNAELELLNQITHSGRYINRIVEVIVNKEGSEDTLDIRWNCRTRDQMMEAKNHFNSLLDCLQQIVKKQKEEDEDERFRNERPRRHFGDTAAYREAAEKAAE